MRRFALPLLLAALALAPVGCTRLYYAAGPQKPVLANHGLERPHRVTSQFSEKERWVYILWGLVPIAGEEPEDIIARQMNLGDGIINLTVDEKYGFVDQIISLLTVGIISTRSFKIKGDLFVWEAPPPAGATIILPPADGRTTVVVPPPEGAGATIVVPPPATR